MATKEDNLFIGFLIASLAAHTAFMITLPALNISPDKNKLQKIEVTYQKIPPLKKDKIKISEIRRTEPIKRAEPINTPKIPPPDYADYFTKVKTDTEAIKKPAAYDGKSLMLKPKKVALLNELLSGKGELPKNPVYLKYYRIIREKIRRYAYYNYNRADSGEAYVSFVVLPEGGLKDLKIVEEKSTLNNYLKEVVIKSIKDASPFPAIPQDLDCPELSFNIIIAFQLD